MSHLINASSGVSMMHSVMLCRCAATTYCFSMQTWEVTFT